MTKPQELFLFFTIKQPSKFKAGLRKTIIPMITSVTEILKRDSNGCQAIVNIGFSATGLQKLDVKDSLNDTFFSGGQFNDSKTLGDVNPDYNWLKAFRGTHIHGVLLIASSSGDVISETRAKIHHALGSSISVAHTLHGAARKGSEVGHERESSTSGGRLFLTHSRLWISRRNLAASGARVPAAAPRTVTPPSRRDLDWRDWRQHDASGVGQGRIFPRLPPAEAVCSGVQ
jgi:hypothetical protein